MFKKAGYDFSKIDSNLFAPAAIIVNNAKTGKIFKAGKINVDVFRQSIGIAQI
jgi:methenyltetrahydromethanopterin cyclohydrolase